MASPRVDPRVISKMTRIAAHVQVLDTLVGYAVQTDGGMAQAGVQLLQALAQTLAPVLDAPAWAALLRALSLASAADLSTVLNPHTRRVP